MPYYEEIRMIQPVGVVGSHQDPIKSRTEAFRRVALRIHNVNHRYYLQLSFLVSLFKLGRCFNPRESLVSLLNPKAKAASSYGYYCIPLQRRGYLRP